MVILYKTCTKRSTCIMWSLACEIPESDRLIQVSLYLKSSYIIVDTKFFTGSRVPCVEEKASIRITLTKAWCPILKNSKVEIFRS